MTEVRARAVRKKGELNFRPDLELLYAAFSPIAPLENTLVVLDELVTDFIIETCHTASRSATYSNRQKIKLEDFKFAVRKGDALLGRVIQLYEAEKEVQKAKQLSQEAFAEGYQGLVRSKGGKTGVGRGKGRTNKRKAAEIEGAGDVPDRMERAETDSVG